MGIKEWNGHTGVCHDSKNGYDVIHCEACGFKHVIPIPSLEELEKIYQLEYYESKPTYISNMKKDVEWFNLMYNDRYDTFEQTISKEGKKLLDIGSGSGYFLLCGQSRGWNVVGIEPSKDAVEYSRGLGVEVVEGFFEEGVQQKVGTFDVIHMSLVVEHLPDPKKLLELAFKMTNSKGLLCITVPNDYNPFQIALKSALSFEPWWACPPHHINYFNFDSLTMLLEKVGYKVFLRETTFPIDMFLLMGDNYIGNEETGRACHSKRMTFEENLQKAGLNDVKRSIYRSFAENNLGREIILFAQKV